MATLKLSAPWIILYKEFCAMFKHDSDVHIIYDEEKNEIKLYVEEDVKAVALTKLLPAEHQFGNVTVKVTVVPANLEKVDLDEEDTATLFDLAFDGNGAYCFSKELPPVFYENPMTFVVFRKEVVQYWTDNLCDYYGQTSILYQDIALDIFGEIPGIYYSTDTEDPVVALQHPLGEWP